MEYSAIIHDMDKRFCYAIDKDLFVILGIYYKNESALKKEIYQSSRKRNNKLNSVLRITDMQRLSMFTLIKEFKHLQL